MTSHLIKIFYNTDLIEEVAELDVPEVYDLEEKLDLIITYLDGLINLISQFYVVFMIILAFFVVKIIVWDLILKSV